MTAMELIHPPLPPLWETTELSPVLTIFQVRAAIEMWRSKRQRTSCASGADTTPKVCYLVLGCVKECDRWF